ncbi:MAG: sigma-70 family RNA polymerase sigma factor [Kiritimatiellae bacterium]|nr:sigma-70 family RNA polymerase sigma factor [Kiritimatiellia bacterium]
MKRGPLSDRERECLGRLVLAYQSRIRAFLCRFVSDPDVLDELTQDVFIGARGQCVEMADWDPDEVGKYLRGIARNLVRMRWRALRRRRAHVAEYTVDFSLQECLAAELERDPDDSEVRVRLLRRCLDGLSEWGRGVVDRHYFKGIPLARIAREESRSEPSVRMAMLRVRQQLRQCIETGLRGEAAG